MPLDEAFPNYTKTERALLKAMRSDSAQRKKRRLERLTKHKAVKDLPQHRVRKAANSLTIDGIVEPGRRAKKLGFTDISYKKEWTNEVAPPGWSGTIKAMLRKHPDKFKRGAKAYKPGKKRKMNPYEIAWAGFRKGYIPHYKPDRKAKGIVKRMSPAEYASIRKHKVKRVNEGLDAAFPIRELNERYGGSKQSVSIWYHGTSYRHLKSILSQGLIPNPKTRTFGDDRHASASAGSGSIRTVGGVYLTKNFYTAYSAAGNANGDSTTEKRKERIILAIQATSRSMFADEDAIKFVLNVHEPYNDSPYQLGYAFAALRTGFSEVNELRKTWVESRVEKAITRWKLNAQQADRLREGLREHWATFVERQAAHAYKGGNDRSIRVALDRIFPERADYDKYVIFDEATRTATLADVLKLKPIPQVENQTLAALDDLTRILKSTVSTSEDYLAVSRIDGPIKFKGANKILCIIGISENPEYKVGDGSLERGVPSELVKIYHGKPPPGMLEEIRQRIGNYKVI